MWGLRSPTLPLTYPTDRTIQNQKRRCNIMENNKLTFEEALIDRLDSIYEALDRIADALECEDDD